MPGRRPPCRSEPKHEDEPGDARRQPDDVFHWAGELGHLLDAVGHEQERGEDHQQTKPSPDDPPDAEHRTEEEAAEEAEEGGHR